MLWIDDLIVFSSLWADNKIATLVHFKKKIIRYLINYNICIKKLTKSMSALRKSKF
jgi:hypothetical protein